MSEQIPEDAAHSGLTPPPDLGAIPPLQPPAPQPTSMWQRLAAWVLLVAVVAAAAGIGIGYGIARSVSSQQTAQVSPIALAPNQGSAPGSRSGGAGSTLNSIAAKVDPAIVDINTTVGSSSAAGTGMIISSTGEILTNNHVVKSSTNITVTVQGRSRTYTAHVIGVDDAQDVAVIQIDQSVSALPTVKFANSSSVQVGDTVAAIGNALGQGGTPRASLGTVTALDQSITASEGGGVSETLNGMIESDAVIYEGDSGGALVNNAGQVVGMITAGQAQGFRSASSNVGYAISANTAVGVANRIRAHEQAPDLIYGQVGYLGVQVQTLDPNIAQQLGVNVSSGAAVAAVVAGSPAASAGIGRGAVITSVGGSPVSNASDLGAALHSHRPGESVSVTWVTASGSHTATVTLGGVNP